MATNGHSGHPLKWFKDQNAARQSWECAICLEVLSDPVQVRDCGHQFCALCIDGILKSDPRCPSCRIKISKAMVFEDHAARRLIKQLEVNCCNEGCSWQGCLGSLLQDHQHSCNFRIRTGDNVHEVDVGKLVLKLEILTLKVSALEKKHEEDNKKLTLKQEEDTKQIKLKHEREIKKLTLKYEEDVKQIKLKHDKDIKKLALKHEEDNKKLTWKHENDMKEVKSQHENDMKEVKLLHAENVKVLRQEILMPRPSRDERVPREVKEHLPPHESEPTYTWKIANFTRKLAQATSKNDDGQIESEPFFSSHGYKMKLAVNINEGPYGHTGYMGVYLILMKSDRDATLSWPFTKRHTFVLVDQQGDLDQRQNISYTAVPDGDAEFERPKQRQREKVGRGKYKFAKHSTLRTRKYIKNHTVYIKVFIDP